jgi:hypothetical protein
MLSKRFVLRNGLLVALIVLSVIVTTQWSGVFAQTASGTVPSGSAACGSLSLAPVLVVKGSQIYYAPTEKAIIPLLSVVPGKTFRVCDGFKVAGWTAFFLAPSSQVPLYVKSGTFAGR